MQHGSLQQRIERAKELLKIVKHGAVASINADGSPLNTPLFVALDKELGFYWLSRQDSEHSQNVACDGRVFLTLFDSTGQGGGLYISANATEVEEGDVDAALTVFNDRRAQIGRNAMNKGEIGDKYRLYHAKPTNIWVNITELDENGNFVREYRHIIRPGDLT